MVTVPEILAAMRDVIATVPGLAMVHYPAPKSIKAGPDVVLYWGGDGDTVIDNDMRLRRMWLPVVRAQVMTPMKGNTPDEFARIDNLLTPIVDAFDAGTPAQVMPSLGGHVDRCQVVRVRPSLDIEYAGNHHYGAEIYFSIKFHRNVEITP